MLLTLFMLINISCSSSNPGEEIIIPETPTTYMPLKDGNYWNYDVQQVNAGAINSSLGIDHLFISNDTLINGVNYKKMKTTAMPNGFFSNTLRNNGVKISGSSLVATGTFNLPFPGLTTPIQISLDNFAFFKDNAPIGTEVGITSGTLQQTVNKFNKICRLLDSKPGPGVSEATALSTVSQPLPPVNFSLNNYF